MRAGSTPATLAIPRTEARSKPFSANSVSAAARIVARVSGLPLRRPARVAGWAASALILAAAFLSRRSGEVRVRSGEVKSGEGERLGEVGLPGGPCRRSPGIDLEHDASREP